MNTQAATYASRCQEQIVDLPEDDESEAAELPELEPDPLLYLGSRMGLTEPGGI